MDDYLLIKHLHVVLALASGLGFALRGFVRLVLARPLPGRAWKVLPHLLDTLLLASGVILWIMVGWPLISWLGVKLVLVLAYILVGMAAFRTAGRSAGVGLYLLALLIFVTIPILAVLKPV